MHFDVVFLDQTSPKYYDRLTLDKSAMGGTEASIVRVAESLGALGLNVAVVQTQCEPFEAIMGQYAYFLHANNLPATTTCDHFVQIRGISALGLFPKAKQYAWLHDLSIPDMASWIPKLKKHDVTLVAVSRWHKQNIKQYCDYDKIKYIYNPCPDEIYIQPGFKPHYDPNTLVWLSSPHKGLGNALLMFERLRKENPKFQLITFNPGYMGLNKEALITMPGVSYYGPMSCKQVWPIIQRSLCVFYPTLWEETFGMVCSESNAVGTPLATYSKGALKEVISSESQLVEDGEEQQLIDKVLDWSKNGRPAVFGKDEFRMSNVIKEWKKLLS